jgi:hypothetical protein
MKNFSKNEWFIIAAFIAVKVLVHFLTNTNYDLHRDTFLYYSLSEDLAWGYASCPPFIAFITRVSTFLFGYSPFSINLFPVIAGVTSIVLIALIVKEFGGKALAITIALLSFLLSPAYLRSNSLMQPVSFDQLFWLASAYFIVKLINTQNTRYWLWIMAVWGVGFMNKYLIAGYAFSFLLALLISQHRKLLFSRNFIWGSLIGFLIIVPNTIWQYQHNWAVFHHLDMLNKSQLVNVSATGFIVDQFMMNLHAVVIWVTGLFVFFLFKDERKFFVLSLATLFILLLLLITHGKSYYTLGAYTLLMAMGGYAIEKYYSKRMKVVAIALTVILAIPPIPFSLPVLSFPAMEKYSKALNQENRWEDGKIHSLPQDYADMTGWKELGDTVIKTYNSLPEDIRENCSIFTDNYGQAGAIYYYGRQYNLPRPISFNDNFLIWAPDSVTNDYLIYVNDELGDDMKFLFNHIEKKGEINNPYFRENGLQVYFCSQPTSIFKAFYKRKVKELKMVYFR